MKKLLTTVAMTTMMAMTAQAADLGPQDIQSAIGTYKANEMRFQRDYVGKTIAFGWTFKGTTEQWFGTGWRVSFGGSGFGGSVDCTDVTDKDTLDMVVNWNKGQMVMVTGTIHDVTMGDLQLKNCELHIKQ